jgi:acetyl esterase/lipase
MRPLLLALPFVLLAAACSESADEAGTTNTGPRGPQVVASSRTASVLERQYGADADGFYLFAPRKGAWKRVVVFVHGHGGPGEITPMYHRPWLEHLAERGSAVVYPRYEQQPGGHGAARHIDEAVRSALAVLGRNPPIVGIGYSRGGRLVVDWAAIAAPAMKPRAIVSVFPASAEDPNPDLAQVDRGTRMLVLTGDRDEVVGPYGATEMLYALKRRGFDLHNAKWHVVESTPDFTVNHLSPLDDSPQARKFFWRPADRLIAETVGGA